MLLDGKVAVVFGAGGAIGGAVARRFAAEGATVHLSGRSPTDVETVATDINASDGVAHAARVDASIEAEVTDYLADVTQRAGGIDVVFNAVSVNAVQGVPLMGLPVTDFLRPITAWTSTQLITSVAAARHMVRRGRGTVITLSASTARLAVAGTGGFGVACAAIEAFSRTLAAELGPQGVRVVCLRPHRIDETLDAPDLPMPLDQFRDFLQGMTVLKRLPTLAEVAGAAAFLASDDAAAMSATVLNMTAGANAD